MVKEHQHQKIYYKVISGSCKFHNLFLGKNIIFFFKKRKNNNLIVLSLFLIFFNEWRGSQPSLAYVGFDMFNTKKLGVVPV